MKNKQRSLADGAKLNANHQIEKLVKEINSLRDEMFEVKKANHHLRMEIKGMLKLNFTYKEIPKQKERLTSMVKPKLDVKRSQSKQFDNLRKEIKNELTIKKAIQKKMTVMNIPKMDSVRLGKQ